MTTTTIAPDVLTDHDKTLLSQYEQQIATGFILVGNALKGIRELRLYREHGTWDAYCNYRWQYSANRADQIIAATRTADFIQMATGIPLENERQVRALNSVEVLMRPQVVQTAKAYADSVGKPLSEGMIRRTAQVYKQAKSGYVDYGSGESNAVIAALTVSEFEAVQRQHEHLRASNVNREQGALTTVASSSTEAVTVLDVTLYPSDAGRTAKVLLGALGKETAYQVMLALSEQFGG